jgi:aspartyl protease family protein
MRAELAAAAIVVVAAVSGVHYWESNTAHTAGDEESAAAGAFTASRRGSDERSAPYRSRWGVGEVRVPAAGDHQYYVTAAVNNAPASFLVDTGASYVALRESDAERAGIYTAWTDFDYPVRTANGETRAALVTIRAIEIDAIRVENVKAFILPDDQLGVNLLGMSFLSRIKSVEASNGELVLRG